MGNVQHLEEAARFRLCAACLKSPCHSCMRDMWFGMQILTALQMSFSRCPTDPSESWFIPDYYRGTSRSDHLLWQSQSA